jgi:Fe2+ or Zn2+ uptake regulation protein
MNSVPQGADTIDMDRSVPWLCAMLLTSHFLFGQLVIILVIFIVHWGDELQGPYRRSDQREAIIAAIRQMGGHSTADQIYEAVRSLHPRISLGTIYRNLRILCEKGQIREVKSGAAFSRFEVAGPRHYHLICRGCGEMQDAELPIDTSLDQRVQATTSFKVEQHRLDFIGLCSKCQALGAHPDELKLS